MTSKLEIELDEREIDLLFLAMEHYSIEEKDIFMRGLFSLHPFFELSYLSDDGLLFDQEQKKLRIVPTKEKRKQ